MLFAMSCTNSTSKVGEDQQSSQQIEYVMNDSLSTDFYTDMKSYVPAEGFIPTADIAVKIAECVLLEIYGKESIEKEKPFSVNLVNGIWVIEGHIPNGNDSALTFCGQSYVEIRKSNGEIIKLSELAKGMMMVSGNDAANAIAITLGKSTDGFAEMMNQKAASLNMKDTHFVTPSGLDDEEHYSSAYDMAMLTAYSMENEQFKETVSQKSITVKYTSPENKTQICNNHNRLLSLYDGCIGVKTGFTKTAGRTLSSCAERNGVRLICVTLNDGDDWNDHQKLYDYGFSKMKTETLCQAKDAIQANVVGGEADEIQLYPSRNINVSVVDGEQCKIESEIILPRFIYAPIRKGKAEGKIIFRVNGKIIGCADLIAKEECKAVIHEKGFFEKLFRR